MSKHVVITGATRGIGHALSESLIAAGHRVSGCGRSAELCTSLRDAHGKPHRFEVVDITSPDKVDSWAQGVVADNGAPDILINNAAMILPNAALWEIPAKDFNQLTDININSVASVIRAFMPSMIEQASGVIINMSSGWGRSTSPEVAPYCASKWAIEGLSQALAQEVPTGLAVVALSPGTVNTDMLQSAFGSDADLSDSPEVWAKRAAPFILRLGPAHNGQSLSTP